MLHGRYRCTAQDDDAHDRGQDPGRAERHQGLQLRHSLRGASATEEDRGRRRREGHLAQLQRRREEVPRSVPVPVSRLEDHPEPHRPRVVTSARLSLPRGADNVVGAPGGSTPLSCEPGRSGLFSPLFINRLI